MKKLQDLSNEELWLLFPIIITEHKDCWKDNYKAEEELLQNLLGKESIVRINHIGSTSVVGLLAKPTIDVLLEVRDDLETPWLIKSIESLGYIYTPQPNNPPPHMMFMKGYTLDGFKGQVYHLHVRYAGDWDELYFRDYLKAYPETAAAYGRLKLELKGKFEHDRDAYTEAKTDFVKSVTEKARAEFGDRYKLDKNEAPHQ